MMKILLDEDVPEQVITVLQHVLRGHQVDHVTRIGWSGEPDKRLYPDAAKRRYDVLVTNDAAQVSDPDECQAVKRSGIHRVSYRHLPSNHSTPHWSTSCCSGSGSPPRPGPRRGRCLDRRLQSAAARGVRPTLGDRPRQLEMIMDETRHLRGTSWPP
jgi:hypothetical protein